MIMTNTHELSTRRELDFVNRIQMIPFKTWSSNGSMFAPCPNVMVAPDH